MNNSFLKKWKQPNTVSTSGSLAGQWLSQWRVMKGPQNWEKGIRADKKASSLKKASDVSLEVKGRISAVLRVEEMALK